MKYGPKKQILKIGFQDWIAHVYEEHNVPGLGKMVKQVIYGLWWQCNCHSCGPV